MKTKLALCGCFVAIVLFAAPQSPQSGQVGRYVLVPATVELAGLKVVSEVRTIFKLDSVSGKAWAYSSHTFTNAGGITGTYWYEIPDLEDLIRTQRIRRWLTDPVSTNQLDFKPEKP